MWILFNSLLALVLGLVCIIEVSGVLHGHLVTLLGLVGAIALLDRVLLDTHACGVVVWTTE